MKTLIYIALITVFSFTLLESFTVEKKCVDINLQTEGGLAIIANPKGAPSEIPSSKLKGILKGEQARWKDGTKVTLAFMKTSTAIGDDMAKRIFNMTAKELNKYFLAQVFQGKMSSPQFFDSEEDLLKFIKSNEGAIGVSSFKNASGVNTIGIDGKKSL